MHAGYPIMAFTAAAHGLVDVDTMKRGMWGPIHELGHNQQRGCWEFPPHTTEGTCNLWSLYVHQEVLGKDWAQVRFHLRNNLVFLSFIGNTDNFLPIAGSFKRFLGKPEAENRRIC